MKSVLDVEVICQLLSSAAFGDDIDMRYRHKKRE